MIVKERPGPRCAGFVACSLTADLRLAMLARALPLHLLERANAEDENRSARERYHRSHRECRGIEAGEIEQPSCDDRSHHAREITDAVCIAVHLPAACGPASVCVMAHTFEANIPYHRQASINNAMASVSSRTNATGKIIVDSASPRPANVFRTRVGEPPRATQRSEIQPEITLETATVR